MSVFLRQGAAGNAELDGAQVAAQRHAAAEKRRDLDAGNRADPVEDVQQQLRLRCCACCNFGWRLERRGPAPSAHRR